MSIITQIGQYIPGSENYGHHEKNIAPLLLAAPGLIKAGTSFIGARARNKESQAAAAEQKSAEFDYKNFDYNQDVGDVNNPYNESVKRESERSQRNIDQAQANQLGLQQQSGAFGATQSILSQQNKASEDAGDRIGDIRDRGAKYVEDQRQGRIQDKYAQAGESLAASNKRLAQAKKAKAMARDQLVSGISSAAGAAVGGGALGKLGGIGGAGKLGGFNASQSFLDNTKGIADGLNVPNLTGGGNVDFTKFLKP